MTLSRIVLVFIIVIAGCKKDTTITDVRMTPEIEKLTTQLSSALVNEFTLCLSFEQVDESTILVNDYYIPEIKYASRNKIVAVPCNDDYQITWHSHPRASKVNSFITDYVLSDAIKEHIDKPLIYLSSTDVKYALHHKVKYMMVGSGNSWAWWSDTQIVQRQDSLIIMPIKQQYKFKR